MADLQGSRWAPNSPVKEPKDQSSERHTSVPNFEFQMPAVAPSKPASSKQAVGPALTLTPASIPAEASTSTPTPATQSPSPTDPAEEASSEPKQAPEKLFSKADTAAAATRARMAEIMGPRRRRSPSSASKQQSQDYLTRARGELEKKLREGEEEVSESKGEGKGKMVENLMD